ncbi:hypothetical protein SAMN05421813_10686 [Daejeonella rubra]|uniref:Uncharacterized protein n=1 Tax=Daejeonella rubra TaxID=990371 RepID=A0A1G9QMN7_9SPHI|nr:hypothetical protein SAMN05421813_10686 [Daejeonella rubra]
MPNRPSAVRPRRPIKNNNKILSNIKKEPRIKNGTGFASTAEGKTPGPPFFHPTALV